jgi:hypothetical protein
VELEPADVTPLDANGRETTASERAVLQPGEAIRMRVRRKIFLAPGDYRGTLTLNTTEESIDAERSVDGALLMKMGPMTVVKPS